MPGIRLNPSFSIIHTGAGVVLRSDLGSFQLYGSDARVFTTAIVPLLDGSRDRDAIADALVGYSRRSILALLDHLTKDGILEIDLTTDTRWRGQEEFLSKWPRSEESTERLRRGRILIAGLEPWGATAAIELAASGVGTLRLLDDGRVGQDDLLSVRRWSGRHLERPRGEAVAEVLAEVSPWCHVTPSSLMLTETGQLALEDTGWDLVIGTGTRDQLQLFQSLARFAHAHTIPSVFGYIDGLEAVVGPAVLPGRTACWNCVRLRRLANSGDPKIAHALQESLLAGHHRAGLHTYLAPMAPLVGHLIALEALKLVSRYTPSHLVGRILVQDLITMESTSHVVIRMPWCDVCGGSSAGGMLPGGAVLGGGTVGMGQEGVRRLEKAKDPGELRRSMAGWIDSRTGVIRDLIFPAPEAAAPELPVTCAAVLSSYTEGAYVSRKLENTSGKGLNHVEAMIAAVGEAIERYSAARCRPADLRRATRDELREDVLDPRQLGLYEDAQYASPGFPFARFDSGRPMAWTRGCWLDTGLPVWVPALLAYRNLRVRREENFCQVTSNGLAAGADFDDAAMRALLELVERDAFMVTWLARRPGRRLLVDDTLDAGTREVLRQLRERGADAEVFLLDAGVRIPVVACVGLGDGRRWPGAHVGLGAHLDPHTAVRKAVFELAHTGPYISRLISDRTHRIPRTPEQVHTPVDHALYYAPAARARTIAFLSKAPGHPVPLAELETPEDVSLAACVRRLTEVGARVAAVDVTSPDVAGSPFRVVRALGVNLQPIDFGFDRRRRACRRLESMSTHGVNPHPHPLA